MDGQKRKLSIRQIDGEEKTPTRHEVAAIRGHAEIE
jgi:hypothetical protein